MTSIRGALLFGALLASVFVIEAESGDLQPSALRVVVASVVALLAPLFWPGCAASLIKTAARIVTWTAACCCIATLTALLVGGYRQSLSDLLRSVAMLAGILLLAHGAAALLEHHLARAGVEIGNAREAASRAVAIALALLGALPLWLGPAAELLSERHAWAIDAVMGLSPLTHLAVASGNDLLRNQWLYQHSNLSGLQFDYPSLGALAWSYGLLCLAAGAVVMSASRKRGVGIPATPTHLPQEKSP